MGPSLLIATCLIVARRGSQQILTRRQAMLICRRKSDIRLTSPQASSRLSYKHQRRCFRVRKSLGTKLRVRIILSEHNVHLLWPETSNFFLTDRNCSQQKLRIALNVDNKESRLDKKLLFTTESQCQKSEPGSGNPLQRLIKRAKACGSMQA